MRLEIFLIVLFNLSSSEDDTFIENFDLRILKELQYPITVNGDYLYQNMLQYYSNLLDILHMIKINNIKVKNYIIKLITDGGPKMLQCNYNLTQLAVTFRWGKHRLADFKTVFSGIKYLWSNITEILQTDASHSESYIDSDSSSSDSGGWI